ncbi:MAG: exosome complex exonuclease Rrp41 [Candidatus Altiarchaeales archaeon WOR_SM1_86-2]|nr:MAG: exosome complex exonuclease Rrp41 [Candidatus Altiarchaeales archaeon WOR_SM1_86-2]
MKEEVRLIGENGLRLDGRKVDELRPIKMEVGVLKRAEGSAYLEWGKNKVIVAVYGPREAHPMRIRDPTKAIIRCYYNMAAFSVEDRKRPGPDRRSVEISKVISDAFESVVLTEKYPNSAIDVFIEILQADAGTRCAGLTCATLALVDAGIPMKDLIAACAAGKVDGEIVLDLMKDEDNLGEADLPVAASPRNNEISLLQLDGNLTKEEFNKALELATKGVLEICEMQKEALMKKYKK